MKPSLRDDYRQRMLAITDGLHAQGVGRYTAARPLYRFAWRLGFRMRPPLYHSFRVIAVGAGLWFAVGWAFVSWFTLWRGAGVSVASVVAYALLGGTLFGIGMATHYRRRAQRVQLPPLQGSILR